MSGLLGRMFLARNHSAFIPIGRNFSYKSDLSLDRLYPNSRLLLCTPPPLDVSRYNMLLRSKIGCICLTNTLLITCFSFHSIVAQSLTKAGKFTGYIPMEEMKVTYSRAGGPGGQNVNRVDTKVDLRFHVNSATWITEATKEKLNEKVCENSVECGDVLFIVFIF